MIVKPVPKISKAAISRERRNMEATIDNMLRVYERNTPRWQLNQFISMVSRARSMADPKGFSPNKHVLHVGEIPSKLAYMMVHVFGQEWRNIRAVSNTFWRRVGKFRINQSTLPQVNEDMLTHDASGIPVKPSE